MYRVFKIHATSAAELENRLNQLRDSDDLELIAVDNHYYIFRERNYEIEAIMDRLKSIEFMMRSGGNVGADPNNKAS